MGHRPYFAHLWLKLPHLKPAQVCPHCRTAIAVTVVKIYPEVHCQAQAMKHGNNAWQTLYYSQWEQSHEILGRGPAAVLKGLGTEKKARAFLVSISWQDSYQDVAHADRGSWKRVNEQTGSQERLWGISGIREKKTRGSLAGKLTFTLLCRLYWNWCNQSLWERY